MTKERTGQVRDVVDTRRGLSRAWRGTLGITALALVLFGVLLTDAMLLDPGTSWTGQLSQRLRGAIRWTQQAHASETYYTCSMHPAVVQEEPGTCPICGMNLVEKELATGTEDAPPEIPSKGGVSTDSDSKEQKIKYWVAPMDPTFISDKPGKSPMGMDLVPVYDEEGAGPSTGVVRIDPVVVQTMGTRTAPVERGTIFRSVRTIGEIKVAEDEISVINLRYSGWVEKIWVDETGQQVKKGQKLFSIYSPELISAQEEYLLAVNTSGKESQLAKAAARRLELWEIPQYHMDRIIKDGNGHRNVVITAPRSGYVLHKSLVQGARVRAGADLYRIGNLQKIWVNAEVYEYDTPWLRVGQTATMELSFQPGKQWEGRVSYVYPTLNKRSRTVTVRLEFPNPGIELKPGMFATVRIKAQHKDDVLLLPTEAIIRSGERQLVFAALGKGRYAPREIVTGLVGDDHQAEVLSGLDAGEVVVLSGQFLLDSESQLEEAVQKMLDARLQIKPKQMQSESGE